MSDAIVSGKPPTSGGGHLPSVTLAPFEFFDASDDDVKLGISDGKIGGEYPDGMTGADDYTFSVSHSGKVWIGVVVDFDPSRPETQTPAANFQSAWLLPATINTRFLDFGETVPADDPSTGKFYLELGSYEVASNALTFSNTRSGHIETPKSELLEIIDNGIIREGRVIFLATPAV